VSKHTSGAAGLTSFIDVVLLVAFALLAQRTAEAPPAKAVDLRQLSISQKSGHLLFIAFDDVFLALDGAGSRVQLEGPVQVTLEGLKTCVDSSLLGREARFLDAATGGGEQGVLFVKKGEDQTIQIDLTKPKGPVYVGIEACCQDRLPGLKTPHPIQGQIFDTSSINPLHYIEGQYDATMPLSSACEDVPDQPKIIAPLKALPPKVRFYEECNVAILELR
jgi:hypothetical protein